MCVLFVILKVTQVTVLLVNRNPTILGVALRVCIGFQLSNVAKRIVIRKRSVLELLEGVA